jgi:hypothetical protein
VAPGRLQPGTPHLDVMALRRIVVPGLICAATVSCAGTAAPGGAGGAFAQGDATGMAPATAEAAAPTARVILKFKDEGVAANSPAVLAALGGVCRCEVAYVRPMSGAAHLVTVRVPPGSSLDEALRRLQADPRVEYADRDSVKRSK